MSDFIDNEFNDDNEYENEPAYKNAQELADESNYYSSADDKGVLPDGRVVLCGANAYEKKYYFNKIFSKLPESIQKELHIICVLFTEEVGGLFYIVFDEDGSVNFETNAEADDIYYDEISSGLLLREIRRTRKELIESLSLYYRVVVLREKPEDILSEIGEE